MVKIGADLAKVNPLLPLMAGGMRGKSPQKSKAIQCPTPKRQIHRRIRSRRHPFRGRALGSKREKGGKGAEDGKNQKNSPKVSGI